MATIATSVEPVLTDEILIRCHERAPRYDRDNTFFVAVHDAIARLFEPLLRPIRRLLPDTGAIDFSPMVLLLAIYAIIIVLESVRPY